MKFLFALSALLTLNLVSCICPSGSGPVAGGPAVSSRCAIARRCNLRGYRPVCGVLPTGLNTYINRCYMECAGAMKLQYGQCPITLPPVGPVVGPVGPIVRPCNTCGNLCSGPCPVCLKK